MFYLLLLLLVYFLVVGVQHLEKPSCPESKDCTWSFPHFVTQNLKCIGNHQCPLGFLCCSDCHYEHYVCKATRWTVENKLCPEDRKFCIKPLNYENTKHYKCTSHTQCYKTDHCCSDSCYTHKVCKSTLQLIKKPKLLCPISIRTKSCTNIYRILTRYYCKSDNDCFLGYICCEDNCYDHMVCKLPKDAFAYRNVYKPSNYTTISNVEQYKCPEIENKCSKSYSLRLAKKFICFKDEDCKLGQMCCKDSCIKYFRICKDLFTLKPEIPESVTIKLSVKEWAVLNIATTSAPVTKFFVATTLPVSNRDKIEEKMSKQKSKIINQGQKAKHLLSSTKFQYPYRKSAINSELHDKSNKETGFYFDFEGSGFDFEFQDQEI